MFGIGKIKKRKLNNGNKLNDEVEDESIERDSLKEISIGDIRAIIEVDILWKGNPINHMKKFGTINCGLCMRERLAILSAMRKDRLNNTKLLINTSGELYGACRHRTRFHRFLKNVTPPPPVLMKGNQAQKKVKMRIWNHYPMGANR